MVLILRDFIPDHRMQQYVNAMFLSKPKQFRSRLRRNLQFDGSARLQWNKNVRID